MKLLLHIACSFLLALPASAGRLSDLVTTIHYTPPTNFYGGIAHPRTDPGDNPLSLTSPEFLEYTSKDSRTANVMFSLALVGAYVGQGKVMHFLPVTPDLMRNEIEEENKRKFPQTTPASVANIHGLTAVNLTASRPTGDPQFLRFCWIQVETNLALKITAIASDLVSFAAATNSLNTINIDKGRFLAAVYAKPNDADVLTNQLQRVELGHMQENGARTGVCVFYTKGKIYSCTVGRTFNPNEDLNSAIAAFGGLQELVGSKNALRAVVIDIAPDIPQTSLLVAGDANPTAGSYFWLRNIQSPDTRFPAPITLIGRLWEGTIPQGFHKESEYTVNATLYIRKQPSSED